MQALAAGQIQGRTEDTWGQDGRDGEGGRDLSRRPALNFWVFARPDDPAAQDGLKVRCKRLQPGLVGAARYRRGVGGFVSVGANVSGIRGEREHGHPG